MVLSKLRLPDSVEVDGSFFHIHTGHPYWFRFSELVDNKETCYGDFDFLYVDEPPLDRRAGFAALFSFFYEKSEMPRSDGDSNVPRSLDYVLDGDLLYAAIFQCYGVDLAAREMHWHTVRALIRGITGTRLNDVMYYRTCKYDSKNQELMRAKTAWALPEKDNGSDKELEEFNQLFE